MKKEFWSRIDGIIVIVLYGAWLAYCVFGAVTGDLYVPGKHGPGVHLQGLDAWEVVGGLVLIAMGLAARERAPIPPIVEMILLFSGIGLLFLGAHPV